MDGIRQKRMRLRHRVEVERGKSFLNPETMSFLEIEDGQEIEIVVAKKKKFRSISFSKGEVPINEVWMNPDELQEKGIADNSIATVRKAVST
jgi:anaerobic selenocysteine-containing dehydrogenase